jgi:hypothetical protein
MVRPSAPGAQVRMGPLGRIALYGGLALAGNYAMNEIRPVTLGEESQYGALGTFASMVFGSIHGDPKQGVQNAAIATGNVVKADIKAQVRFNIIAGTMAGIVLAGLIDGWVIG